MRTALATIGLSAIVTMSGCYGSDGDTNTNGQGNSGGGGATAGSASQGGAGSNSGGTGGTTIGGNAGSGGSVSGGAGSGGGGYSECVETPSDITAEETTPLGFSANSVLAVPGLFQTDLLWMQSNLYATHALAGTTTLLDFGLQETQPAAVRYVDSQGGGCVGGDGPCIQCLGRIEIDLELALVSYDGALDEHFMVTLLAQSVDAPTLSANVDAGPLQGSYLAGVTPESGYSLTGLHIEAGFGVGFSGSHTTVPGTWNGFVAATLRADGSSSDIMQAHGYFPAATGM